MSKQKTLYKDYAVQMRSKQPSQIDEEPHETEQRNESKSQMTKKLSNLQITPLSDQKFKQIASTIRTLPEMPESAKNIAMSYINNKLSSDSKIPLLNNQEDKRYDNLGQKLLNGIKSIGSGNTPGLQSQMSRNGPSEQNNMNRSFSLKSLNNNLGQKAIEKFNLMDEDLPPKMSARIQQLTEDHLINKDKISQTLNNQHSIGSSISKNNQGMSGYLNLGAIKGLSKNIIITQSQTIPSHKLSPLPEKYQGHLPNIIKKKISDATSTSFNFNPNISGYNNHKQQQQLNELKNLEQLQSQLRQDVSYLGEKDNQTSSNMPTVFTTGNRAQDELLEATLGMKNMGKSLINLPQTIEELKELLSTYDKKKRQSLRLNRYETEQKNLERYLQDNFAPLDTIQEDLNQSDIQLPGVTLKQFQNNLSNQSKFLANQVSQIKAQKKQNYPFNIQDKSQISPSIVNLDKQPQKVETKPDKLVLIDNKIVKKFAKEAFFGVQEKSQEHRHLNTEKKSSQNLSASKDIQNKTLPIKNLNISHLKSMDNNNILNSSKFQSLQNSWLNDEKSQERTQTIQQTNQEARNSSLSPINIKTHKQISNNTLITQIVQSNNSGNYGNPSSRQDAILLIVWFEKMLLQVQQEHNQHPDQDDSNQFAMLQLIMNICVKELSRQVSVQCLERGLILQKVFQSYAKLIDLINNDNKMKRWKYKREIADKLDRYITIQESQIKGYQDKIEMQKLNEEVLRRDLDDCLMRLNQANVLISKFKKKCWNAQKDFEGSTRKLKLLERENSHLKQQVEDLSEKLGEELSEIDETDRKRMLLKIDEELADEQHEKQLESLQDNGDTLEDLIDIDQIPDRDVIKEDDKATDMFDFEFYLKAVDLWNFQDNETQTERVFKKHVKLGVKPEKLGILKDKETFIDARMFYGDKQSIQIRVGGDQQQHDSIKIEDQEQNLQEDDSELYDSSSDSDNGFKIRRNRSDSSLDNDETLKELGLITDQMMQRDNTQNDGFMTLDITGMKGIRKTSLQGEDFSIEDLDENNLKDLPQYGTQQVEQIITKPSRVKHSKNVGVGNDSQNVSIRGFDDDNKSNGNNVQVKKEKQPKKNTLMQIFAERIKQRLKDLMHSAELDKIKAENEQFASNLINDLKHTQKEVKQMNSEIHKKEKQVRFQLKLNIKNEKDLKDAIDQIDQLEMDNYNLREQMNEIIKFFEEYEGIIQELLKMLDRDSMGQLTINELKNKLLMLTDKIAMARQKSLQQLNDDDATENKTNNAYTSINDLGGKDGNQGLDLNDDATSSMNQTGQNFNPKTRNLMPNANSKGNKKSKFMNTSQDKMDPKSIQEMLRKKAVTRFQMFNLGKRRKSPSKSKTHPSQILLRKMQSKEVKKIRDIMPRKMLLRVIWQIYQERGPYDLTALNQQTINLQNQATIQQQAQNVSTTPINDKNQMIQTTNSFNNGMVGNANQVQTNQQVALSEWIYENFMQKYGLKNVAEKKFCQLIGSCIIMKDQLPRIRLFARFMEIYDELAPSDYNRYLEINDMFQQQVLNFKIDDDLETILLPVNRAVDYYRMKFESKYNTQAFTQRLQKIEKMKVPVGLEESKTQRHLKNVREAIDYDRFIEFVLDTYSQLQEEREAQIRDIFFAADINGDGLMSYNEFTQLMKVFHYKSLNDIWKLFEEYSSIDQDASTKTVKYLNLDQFIQLCLDKDYFTAKVQSNFCQSKNIEKDFKNLTDNMPQTVLLFKARLRETDMQDDFESLELIENFQNCIKIPFSERVGWLCYRIVDEILKRLFTKKLSEKYMPTDIKKMGMKVKPSQGLFNMLPINLFDTL